MIPTRNVVQPPFVILYMVSADHFDAGCLLWLAWVFVAWEQIRRSGGAPGKPTGPSGNQIGGMPQTDCAMCGPTWPIGEPSENNCAHEEIGETSRNVHVSNWCDVVSL